MTDIIMKKTLDVTKSKRGYNSFVARFTKDPIVIATTSNGAYRPDGTTALFSSDPAHSNYVAGEMKAYYGGIEIESDVTFKVQTATNVYGATHTTPDGLRIDVTEGTGVYTLSEDIGSNTNSETEWISDTEEFILRATVSGTKAKEVGLLPSEILPVGTSFDIGSTYKIETFVAGDDFDEIGAINTTGNVFTATGTTPTTWSNGSVIHKTVSANQVLDIAKAKKGESAFEGRLTNDPVVIVTGPQGQKDLDGTSINYAGAAGDFQVFVYGVNESSDDAVQFQVSGDYNTGTKLWQNFSTITHQTTNTSTEDDNSNLEFTIQHDGDYSVADKSGVIWNSDATEFGVRATIAKDKAKEWGLSDGSVDLTIDKTFTISKNKVGALADFKLKRDPVVIPTNVEGKLSPTDGVLDFTQTGTSYTGDMELTIRKDTGGVTTLTPFYTSATDYLFFKVFTTDGTADGLRVRITKSDGTEPTLNPDTSTSGQNATQKNAYYASHLYYTLDQNSAWTNTVEHTEFILEAQMGATTAIEYGLGGSVISFKRVLDVARAREGTRSVELRLTNDPVVLPTNGDGTKLTSGLAFETDATWDDEAAGNADVYFGGVKYDDNGTDITYGFWNGSSVVTELTKNDLTMQISSTTGAYNFKAASYNDWDTDAENFTIRATISLAYAKEQGIVKHNYATAVTLDKVYTVSKAKQGVDGATTFGKGIWNFKADKRTLAIGEVSSSIVEFVTTSTGAITVGVEYNNAGTLVSASQSATTWQVVADTDNKKVTIYAPLFYDSGDESVNYSEVKITWTQDGKDVIHSITRVDAGEYTEIVYDSNSDSITKQRFNTDGTAIDSQVTTLVPASGTAGEKGESGGKGTKGHQGDWHDGGLAGDPDKVRSVTVSGTKTQNYTNNEIITATGGGGSGFSGHLIVNSSGVVTAVGVLNGGSGYTSEPTISAPLGGAGQTFAAVLGTGDRSDVSGIKGTDGEVAEKGAKGQKGLSKESNNSYKGAAGAGGEKGAKGQKGLSK